MNLSTSQLRMLGSVMYFAAFPLLVNYMAEFMIKVWPMKFSELNWRVGAAGLVTDVLLGTIIPQAFLYFAAFMRGDRKTLQVLRWITLVTGVLAIALLLGFTLDSVQIRSQLPQNLKGNFMKAALKAGLIGTMLASLFIWFGLTVGKVLKSQGTVRAAGGVGEASPESSMLMVGSREPSRANLRAIDGDAKKEKKDNVGLTVDI